jgi:plasmid maintenance system antidote protein VapI
MTFPGRLDVSQISRESINEIIAEDAVITAPSALIIPDSYFMDCLHTPQL